MPFFTSLALAAGAEPIRGSHRRALEPDSGGLDRGQPRAGSVQVLRLAPGMGVAAFRVGMGTGERKTGVRVGLPAPYLGIQRPRVAGPVHPPGRGASPGRPVTAHLRETAPRSSAPKSRSGCEDALTGIRPMRYGSTLSGVCARVGKSRGLRVWRPVRRSRGNAEGSRGDLARGVHMRRDQWSRFGTDRSHGDADGVREGRRVRLGSRVGFTPDRRAGSLVRRCKGCSGVVFSHEVPGSR